MEFLLVNACPERRAEIEVRRTDRERLCRFPPPDLLPRPLDLFQEPVEIET